MLKYWPFGTILFRVWYGWMNGVKEEGKEVLMNMKKLLKRLAIITKRDVTLLILGAIIGAIFSGIIAPILQDQCH